jgi:hypothetical protein
MKSLIRNCAHGSEIYLLEKVGDSGDVESIWKSSSSPEGIQNLHQDLAGFNWYNSKNEENIKVAIDSETSHYISVKYEYIRGTKADFADGYRLNKKWISMAVEHYCDIWGGLANSESELYPLHGDLSLDNFIFRDDSPVILDWEHFSGSAAPLGFDGLYLLFEAIWFEVNNKIPKKETLSHLAYMIALMRDKNCLDNRYLVNPLSQIIQFIQSHLFLWGTQLESNRNKLPILLFKEKVVENVDRQINTLIEQCN